LKKRAKRLKEKGSFRNPTVVKKKVLMTIRQMWKKLNKQKGDIKMTATSVQEKRLMSVEERGTCSHHLTRKMRKVFALK